MSDTSHQRAQSGVWGRAAPAAPVPPCPAPLSGHIPLTSDRHPKSPTGTLHLQQDPTPPTHTPHPRQAPFTPGRHPKPPPGTLHLQQVLELLEEHLEEHPGAGAPRDRSTQGQGHPPASRRWRLLQPIVPEHNMPRGAGISPAAGGAALPCTDTPGPAWPGDGSRCSPIFTPDCPATASPGAVTPSWRCAGTRELTSHCIMQRSF